MLIDEVQYAPQLFPYIKLMADQRRQCGDFWLTGSQMFRMMKEVSESMSGRVAVIPMLGLSSAEMDARHPGPFLPEASQLIDRVSTAHPMGIAEVFERIYRGSMPRLYENPDVDLELYYESYLNTYLTRDIRDLGQVADLTAFMTFLRVAAARTGSIVNYSAMAQEVGVSSPTIKSWMSLLISAGLVLMVQPYSSNALKRLVKSPRMYFTDTGLCAHLMGWSSAAVLENSAMSGAFFETWVISEIYRSYLNAGKTAQMYFYRDTTGREIDLILQKDGVLWPIEIKKSAAPQDATRNFGVLQTMRENGEAIGTGTVICMASDLIPKDRQNWYVPAWCI